MMSNIPLPWPHLPAIAWFNILPEWPYTASKSRYGCASRHNVGTDNCVHILHTHPHAVMVMLSGLMLWMGFQVGLCQMISLSLADLPCFLAPGLLGHLCNMGDCPCVSETITAACSDCRATEGMYVQSHWRYVRAHSQARLMSTSSGSGYIGEVW